MVRQFIIQLENHPGELAHLARALSARGVDIKHISCVGAGPLSCAMIDTSDEGSTREVLHGIGHDFIEGEALVVDVEDRTGGFADVTERLAHAGVNISATLCVGRRPGIVEMAFAVDDVAKAREALGMTHPVGAEA
jgi:hypothetical protein